MRAAAGQLWLLPRLALPLLVEHLPNFTDAGGVLGLLVRGSKGDDPGEAQAESGLVAVLAGCVPRAAGDLVSQDLNHDLRLEPYVRDENRIHPSRLVADLQPVHPLVNLSPSLVGKAGAQFADGHELISIAVVHAGEKGSRAKLRPLALAAVVAEQDNVDGVGQLTARVPLQLHPVEVPRAGLVGRVKAFGHDPLQAAA